MKKLILIGILILSFGLRFYGINQNPPGLSWDEAALGYNAYSILKTGRDEYGSLLPIIFKSFGDYKPGLYVYLDLPFIVLFGLNEFSTRLPSLILGSLIPLLGYLILKQTSKNENLSLVSAFTLAISPWLINFSRGAWEVNIFLFEILLALYFFLRARQNIIFLVLSIFMLVCSLITYQSAKLFSSVFLVSLYLLYYKDFWIKEKRKWVMVSLAVFVLMLGATVIDPASRSRLNVLNQYSYQRSDTQIGAIKDQDQTELSFDLFHSHQLDYLYIVSSRYINYFSPKFLFIDGVEDLRQGIYNFGLVLIYGLVFYIVGLYFLIREPSKYKWLILILLISPISAALSRDATSAVRALPLAFGLEVLISIGIYNVCLLFKKYQVIFSTILALVIGINMLFYFDQYYVHTPIHSSKYWIHGMEEAVNYVEQNKNKYNRIVFSTAYNEPYIFYLFYTKYDPAKFQVQSKLIQWSGDVGEVTSVDNIEFRPIYFPDERGKPGGSFVGKITELPSQDIDPKESRIIKRYLFFR